GCTKGRAIRCSKYFKSNYLKQLMDDTETHQAVIVKRFRYVSNRHILSLILMLPTKGFEINHGKISSVSVCC
ncbi:hypothetical protein GOODEAATRI_030806, partial [Goodea atripinnis]